MYFLFNELYKFSSNFVTVLANSLLVRIISLYTMKSGQSLKTEEQGCIKIECPEAILLYVLSCSRRATWLKNPVRMHFNSDEYLNVPDSFNIPYLIKIR